MANLQQAGYQVALVTDGRLSGASGKVPAALPLSPEALHGGAIALIEDGDMICLDINKGTLDNLADTYARRRAPIDTESGQQTWGRNLFQLMRHHISSVEQGASFLFNNNDPL